VDDPTPRELQGISIDSRLALPLCGRLDGRSVRLSLIRVAKMHPSRVVEAAEKERGVTSSRK